MLDFDDVTSDGFYDMGIDKDYASLKVRVLTRAQTPAHRVDRHVLTPVIHAQQIWSHTQHG